MTVAEKLAQISFWKILIYNDLYTLPRLYLTIVILRYFDIMKVMRRN